MNYEAQSETRKILPEAERRANVHVKEVVGTATEELRKLVEQRFRITNQIETIKRTLTSLARMFGEDVLTAETSELIGRNSGSRVKGFSAACRQIILQASGPLSAIEVCECLRREFPNILLRHKDPVASVTTVLNRLISYGEARAVLQHSRKAFVSVAAEISAQGEKEGQCSRSPTGSTMLLRASERSQ